MRSARSPALGGVPEAPAWLNTTVEMLLKRDVQEWLDQSLPRFLDYVYFDTPTDAGSEAGEYLRSTLGYFRPSSPQDQPLSPGIRPGSPAGPFSGYSMSGRAEVIAYRSLTTPSWTKPMGKR
jgi:hypothetical protein